MFTVIFHDKEMKKFLDEYKIFLQPFMKKGDIRTCQWYPDGETIEDALPGLYGIVGERREWRAIVLSHCFCDVTENPYDFSDTPMTIEESRKYPLIRLTHMLSHVPHKVTINADEEDSNLETYKTEQTIHYDIEYDTEKDSCVYDLVCARPVEIDLISTRQVKDIVDQHRHMKTHRGGGDRFESLFWDRNNYPSNVRFLTYDLHTNSNKISSKDIFEMVNAILVYSMNDPYTLKLDAYSLYNLSIDVNQKTLEDILANFQQKLFNISTEINRLRVVLANNTLEKQMPGEVPSFDSEYLIEFPDPNIKELMAGFDEYGLASDCPKLDLNVWYNDKKRIDKAYDLYKKKPIRAVKQSIGELKEIEKIKNKPARGYFSEFQMEDAKEKMEELERDMFSLEIAGGLTFEQEEKQRTKAAKAIVSHMGIRMPRKEMILASLFALFVFIAGFVPYIVSAFGDGAALAGIFGLLIGGTAIFCGAGYAAMYRRKMRLFALIHDYNDVMQGILDTAQIKQQRIQEYVSKAFNYRRYWFFKKTANKHSEKDAIAQGIPNVGMLRQHMAATESALHLCDKLRVVYGITERIFYDVDVQTRYYFLSSPEATGYYRFPKAESTALVTCKRARGDVRNPYDYIDRLNLEREVIYDD